LNNFAPLFSKELRGRNSIKIGRKQIYLLHDKMRQLNITKQLTNRENESLDKYLHDISKVELISAEEEVELARKIKEGDTDALERLTKANLRFVVSVAKQYQNQGLNLPDLINEGNLGLIKAAHRFDETRGFKFISYAVWWIRQAILQALADQSRIVRLPFNKIGILNKIRKAHTHLEQHLNREPKPYEIAAFLDIPEAEIWQTLQQSGRHLSMDASLTQDEGSNLYDVLNSDNVPMPDKKLNHESLRMEIDRLIQTLEPCEATVIKMCFGLDLDYPMTFEEIGEQVNLTREQVRQLKKKALRQLKIADQNHYLEAYL
jgi:RNA polymerase primary sigma factor